SAVRHANIVQRVKSCYKIKIGFRESKSCFYGILATLKTPTSTYKATLTLSYSHFQEAVEPLPEEKRGSTTRLKCLFSNTKQLV
uniref:hypothetical protein n=1 Tax=Prevotella sp. TaxID=59823 RepID=UPI0025FCA654